MGLDYKLSVEDNKRLGKWIRSHRCPDVSFIPVGEDSERYTPKEVALGIRKGDLRFNGIRSRILDGLKRQEEVQNRRGY